MNQVCVYCVVLQVSTFFTCVFIVVKLFLLKVFYQCSAVQMCIQGGPQKTKLSYFVHIFGKCKPIFSPVGSVRNLLLIGMHTTPTMSLHYFVKHKYLKTNNIKDMDKIQ